MRAVRRRTVGLGVEVGAPTEHANTNLTKDVTRTRDPAQCARADCSRRNEGNNWRARIQFSRSNPIQSKPSRDGAMPFNARPSFMNQHHLIIIIIIISSTLNIARPIWHPSGVPEFGCSDGVAAGDAPSEKSFLNFGGDQRRRRQSMGAYVRLCHGARPPCLRRRASSGSPSHLWAAVVICAAASAAWWERARGTNVYATSSLSCACPRGTGRTDAPPPSPFSIPPGQVRGYVCFVFGVRREASPRRRASSVHCFLRAAAFYRGEEGGGGGGASRQRSSRICVCGVALLSPSLPLLLVH